MSSFRKAINEKCKECIYDNLAPGTWKQQVSLCTAESCPLWKARPKSKSSISKNVLYYYGIKSSPSQAREPLNVVGLEP